MSIDIIKTGENQVKKSVEKPLENIVSKEVSEWSNIPVSQISSDTKKDITNVVSDEKKDQNRKKLISTAEIICKKKIKLPLANTLKLLEEFEKLEKKPQYKLISHGEFNEKKGIMETFFTLEPLDEIKWEYSKLNIWNIVNYSNFVDIRKEWEDFILKFNYINLNRDRLPLLKRQLYYTVYIDLIKKWVKTWFRDFDKIINKYIDWYNYYNDIKNQDNFEMVIAWPDLFEKDEYDKEWKEIIKKWNIEDIYIWNWLNSQFIKKVSSFFGEVEEFDDLKEFDLFYNRYYEIIEDYKSTYDIFYKEKIQDFKAKKKKYLFLLDKINEGSDEAVKKVLEKNPNLKNDILLELEKIETFFRERDEIDISIDVHWIWDFKKRTLSLHKKMRDDLENQKRKLSKDNDLDKKSKEIQDRIYKETAQAKKIEKYCSDYESFNLNEKKSFSKNIEKWDIVFGINFKKHSKFFGIDWKQKEKRILHFITHFNIHWSTDFEFKLNSDSLKIISKKSWILIDSFNNWKILLTIDTKLYKDYKISWADWDENFKEPFEKENYDLASYVNKDYEHRNIHIEKLKKENKLEDIAELEDLAKSSVWKLEYSDYDYPQIYISKNCNIDHLKWMWVFWKNLNIYSVNAYPEWIDQKKIVKPNIFWEKIYIHHLENNDQKINLISDDYLNLALLENEKKLNWKWKDLSKDELIFDYTPILDTFLSPTSFIKKITKKIDEFNTNIEWYENRKKRFVNLYVDTQSYLHWNLKQKEIYNKMDEKLVFEINRIEKWKLFHDLVSIKKFLKEKIFQISEQEKSILWENWFNKLRKLFYSICETYFDSNENKKNIKIRNFYKKSLENIEDLNTSQEINIWYNSADGVLLQIDSHYIKNLEVEWNLSKIDNSIYVKIPKWIWITIKIENWKVICTIKKTLDDLIKEKMELIDNSYFSTFSWYKYKTLSINDKILVDSYIQKSKEALLKEISWQVFSVKDVKKIELSKNINTIFWLTALSNLKKRTKQFEEDNRIWSWMKKVTW